MKTKLLFKTCNLLKTFDFIWGWFSFVFPPESKETYRLLFIRHCFRNLQISK